MIRFLQTQGKAKKIVLGVLLLIICGSMVVAMVPGGILGDALGYGGGSANAVATVGGQEILLTDVDLLARQLGRQQFPRGMPAQLMPFMRQRAADTLISKKALQVEAARMGFTVSDAELRESLRRIPELFPGGQFIGDEAYQSFITQATGVPVPEFEKQMKLDMLVGKLRNAVEAGLTVSESDILKQYRHENIKVKFQYAVVSLESVEKDIHPSDKDLLDFYNKNKQQYANSLPEKRKIEYVVVDAAQLHDSVKVSSEEVQRFYTDHQDQYRSPEQVQVRHILIKTPAPAADGKMDEKAVSTARQKAEDLLAQVKKGGNFAELAKKNSDDPGSATQGGSLGWIQRGRTVPEFEQAAFSLPKGSTSGIIRTTYGFHILQVEDKKAAQLKSLDEVKSEIESAMVDQKSAERATVVSNAVQSQARTVSLSQAAKQNGVQAITSNLFTRGDSLPGIGSSPEFMEAVFASNSNARAEITHTPQGYVIFNVLEVKPPATPTFDEVKARVEQEIKGQRAQQLLLQKTNELSEQARAAHDLGKAAKAIGAEFKTSELVGPNDQVPDVGSMAGPGEAAFSMKPGEISGPINSGRGGVVLQLVDKQEPPVEQLAASRDRIRDTLLEQKRSEFFGIFVDNLRKQMEQDKRIRINVQVMNQLAGRGQTGD